MWWTFTIHPTSSAVFTHVCSPVATKALSDQSSYFARSLFSLWVWMFCTACCSEALPACFVSRLSPPSFLMLAFQMSRSISSEAPDAAFGPCKLWASSLLVDIKQDRCQSLLLRLSFAWFHSAFLSVLLCFHGDVPCAQLSCVQYTTPAPPPFPISVLASVRTRLIAGAELYIQVNSWDGWPLLIAYVLFVSHSHSAVTFSKLAWLYPLGPSEFVRLNFQVVCVQLCPLSLGFFEAARYSGSSKLYKVALLQPFAYPLLMFNSVGYILMHLPSLPGLR